MVSSAFLPFLAGLFIVRAGGKMRLAVLGGVSISAVSIFVVAISYAVTSAGLMASMGFIIATFMFAIIPQAISGALGGLVGKKVYTNAFKLH